MSPAARVVHVRRAPYDVYIGRRCAEFPASPWGNPYRVGRDGDGPTVLRLYREHVLSRPDLVAALESLRGQVLGCWCRKRWDEPCHGDVLVQLLEERGGSGALAP